MNEILQKIMEFINNNTLILIGICVFLILVLIGYLIDNSVKSKRVRNDIKNAGQVPENIKNEIIKEAEEKKETEKVMEQMKEERNKEVVIEPKEDLTQDTPVIDNIATDVNTPQINDLNVALNLDNNINNDASMNSNLDLDSTMNNIKTINTESIDTALNLDNSVNNVETFNLDLDKKVEENYVDPDAYIMNSKEENNDYSNDKKLSEILSNINKVESKEDNFNLFTNPSTNSIDESSDELDRIMRKLSSMNNNVQDDNYTNIF